VRCIESGLRTPACAARWMTISGAASRIGGRERRLILKQAGASKEAGQWLELCEALTLEPHVVVLVSPS